MVWINGQKVKLCKYCSEHGHTQFQCPKRKLETQKKQIKKPITRKHQKTSGKRNDERRKIINLLDKEFSRYWRMTQVESHGCCRCFICNKLLSYEDACIGHYKSRRYISTRFNPFNANVICYKCNEINSKQPEILKTYRKNIIDRYGVLALSEIENSIYDKISTEELKNILSHYRQLNKQFKK